MFAFHTLPFTLWLSMIDPCYVASDDSNNGSLFITIVVQMLTDVHGHMFMVHCELFRDPFCTDLMKPKSVVDDFRGRTMTNLWTICHFNRHCLTAMLCAHSILSSFVVMVWRPARSSRITLVQPFVNFSTHL
jgi:hypothetical protein